MNARRNLLSRSRTGLVAGVVVLSTILGGVITGYGTAGPTPVADPITAPVITPGGGAPTFAVLLRRRTAEDRITAALPPEVLAGINVSQARLARWFLGVRIYVAPMLEGPDICVIMINRRFATPEAALNCAPPAWLATGRQAMKLQGARGDSAIYAGIVPDGVQSVTVGTEASQVMSNVIVLRRENGLLSRWANYRLSNGEQRPVVIPVDDESATSPTTAAPSAPVVSAPDAVAVDRGLTPPPD